MRGRAYEAVDSSVREASEEVSADTALLFQTNKSISERFAIIQTGRIQTSRQDIYANDADQLHGCLFLFLGCRRERDLVLGLEAMTMMTGGRRRLLFCAEMGLFAQRDSNGVLRLADEVAVEMPWACPARPAPAMNPAPLPLPRPLLHYQP